MSKTEIANRDYLIELFDQLDKEGRVMVIRAAVEELRRVEVDGANRYRTEGKPYTGDNVIPFRKWHVRSR